MVAGMTGYCGKDDVPGNSEFRCYLINVSSEEYAKGKAFYATRARPNLKKLVMLDRKNILHKAYTYARLTARGQTTDLVSILLAMCRSGHYYASTEWVARWTGEGMDFARSQAAFNLMMDPQNMRREDVIHLFFKAHSRWEKSKYYSWCQDYHEEAAWAAKDWANENVEVRPYL